MTIGPVVIVHREVTCPYCWQTVDLAFDLSVPAQEYVEDCAVCCRPMVVRYAAEEGELLDVSVTAEEDA